MILDPESNSVKFVSEMGKSYVSATPKTDEQILMCFRKSRTLVRTWTLCLIISSAFGICLWLYLSGQLKLDATLFISIWGVLVGSSTAMGVASNLVNLAGLNSTCKCLKTCGDGKTIRFMYLVKKIRYYTLMDTGLIFIPPAKIFSTFMIKYHSRKLKPMLSKLEEGLKYKVY